MLYLQLLPGCSSNSSKAVWNRADDMNNYAWFLPANPKESRIWQEPSEARSSRTEKWKRAFGPFQTALYSSVLCLNGAQATELPSLQRTCPKGVTQLHTPRLWPLYLAPSPAIIVHVISLQKLPRLFLSPASSPLFPTNGLLQPSFPWPEFALPLGRLHIHFTQ